MPAEEQQHGSSSFFIAELHREVEMSQELEHLAGSKRIIRGLLPLL